MFVFGSLGKGLLEVIFHLCANKVTFAILI